MYGFCPLASGSKGNAIFIGTQNTRILIDAGIGVRVLSERLAEIGVSLSDIDAILVTHEHTDHISGLPSITRQHKIPIFANADTAKAILHTFDGDFKFKIFSTGEPFTFGDLEIQPFSIQHDTLDPVAFTIHYGALKMGFCADIGFVTSLVKSQLKNCDYLYLEANHEPSMVHSSHRPMIYKQRVLSRQGHLSNGECADLLAEIAHADLKHIHLAHLSQECNAPEVALRIVREKVPSIPLSIAYQDVISAEVKF
ncbi:MAG: MBL fold metallo-hydrolase [Verrucomicrobia bacterium]|nr:MBL fold metallo-hydrolase [Verrucomicrobiota bacterium]